MKTYTVRYTHNGNPVIAKITTNAELNILLSGSAANSKIETKMSENMPVKMHNLIGGHNWKIEQSKSNH